MFIEGASGSAATASATTASVDLLITLLKLIANHEAGFGDCQIISLQHSF
jgi:hypothetical protein